MVKIGQPNDWPTASNQPFQLRFSYQLIGSLLCMIFFLSLPSHGGWGPATCRYDRFRLEPDLSWDWSSLIHRQSVRTILARKRRLLFQRWCHSDRAVPPKSILLSTDAPVHLQWLTILNDMNHCCCNRYQWFTILTIRLSLKPKVVCNLKVQNLVNC